MVATLVLGAVGVASAGGVALAVARKRAEAQADAAQPIAPLAEIPGAVAASPKTTQPGRLPGLKAVGESLNKLKDLGAKLGGTGAAGAAGIAGIVVGGGAAMGLAGVEAVKALGGSQATQNAIRIAPFAGGPPVVAGVIAHELLRKGGETAAAALGIKATQHEINQAATLGVAAGSAALLAGGPAVIGVVAGKAVLEGASALLGGIAGKAVESSVRETISQADPFKSGTVAASAVGAVAGLAQSATDALGSLVGIKPSSSGTPRPPTPEELERAAQTAAQLKTSTSVVVKSALSLLPGM